MYHLYYAPNNASMAVHFVLHHLALDHELILVDKKNQQQKTADYLALNPAGRIPVLIDNHQPVSETSAILMYLCEKHPDGKLMPQPGSPFRGQFLQWLAYLNNSLQAEIVARYYPHRHTTDKEGIPAVIVAQETRVAEILEVLDNQLNEGPYLLGDHLTVCDFLLFVLAGWTTPMKMPVFEFPNLMAFMAKMSQLPTIQTVCEFEGVDLSKYR